MIPSSTRFTMQRFAVAAAIGLGGAFSTLACATEPGDDVTRPTRNNTTEREGAMTMIPSSTRFTMQRFAVAAAIGLGGACSTLACATEPGDDVTCPTCNNTTELLVGLKCVPIAQVAECGPDGHAHGDACHCFGGQQPTAIGAQSYCLQQGCGESTGDPSALACDEIPRAPEAVTAVTTVADVDDAHVNLGKVAEVTLPAGQESFVHFEADEAGEILAHMATGGILVAALDGTGAALHAAIEGPNEDCATVVPEVWGIQVASAGPVVLKFHAGTTPSVRLVLHESTHTH